MKNLLSLLFATILTIGVSVAQERGPRQNRTPEEMAKNQVERLTEQLSLTKPQQDSILNYSLKVAKDQKAIFDAAGDDRQAAFEKMRTIREESNNKIKSFLTKEQVVKYDELLKTRGQGGQRRPNNSN